MHRAGISLPYDVGTASGSSTQQPLPSPTPTNPYFDVIATRCYHNVILDNEQAPQPPHLAFPGAPGQALKPMASNWGRLQQAGGRGVNWCCSGRALAKMETLGKMEAPPPAPAALEHFQRLHLLQVPSIRQIGKVSLSFLRGKFKLILHRTHKNHHFSEPPF